MFEENEKALFPMRMQINTTKVEGYTGSKHGSKLGT